MAKKPEVVNRKVEGPGRSLSDPVTKLYGVGPERAALLQKLGMETVEQLLLHRPRRYEDRRHVQPISELQQGDSVITRGKVVAMGVKWFAHHSKCFFELVLEDGTGRLYCRWWQLAYMEKYFARGDEVVVFGKVRSVKPRTMDNPESEVVDGGEELSIHLGRITPIYPLTEGLPQRWLRALIWRSLAIYEPCVGEPHPELGLADEAQGAENREPGEGQIKVPETRGCPTKSTGLVHIPNLMTRARALRLVHFPENEGDEERARQRLAVDEFVEVQLALQARRKRFEEQAQALPCGGDNHLIKPFLAKLGFTLTKSQTLVLREIRREMSGTHPMRRLLQGDVGSGKTVVGACCALMALESGFDVALMAPTEILAEQHFRSFSKWFGPLGVSVEIRTGQHKTENAADGREDIPGRSVEARRGSRDNGLHSTERGASSRAQPLAPSGNESSRFGKLGLRKPVMHIGTHALIEEGFAPENLGLVVIDEQHKFGVAQRQALLRKGTYPHLLVMTATPIPRTLGLTVYGDLDISTLTELPPGRGKIHTYVRTADKLPDVWTFIRSKLAEGRQAYVVYPRVEETGEGDMKAVTREFEGVRKAGVPFRVGLVHGRLESAEKEKSMEAFRGGELKVLLATSLIEVGVDVPNATVMLIENAELFGLAQLHQLRGRIGRGSHDSWCILIGLARNPESRKRLQVLADTTDGFRIAEADLQLRGPGELLGDQQSGLPKFTFGELGRDLTLVQFARNAVAAGRAGR
jgi:ATP-dependent DNA helicase RecG